MLTLSNHIKLSIEKKIRHSYVEQYIHKPFIDLDKITMLQFLYQDKHLSQETIERYITTIMLVQIALDTHEAVPNNNVTSMSETEKQLSVLSGDYYSGLYYSLLAEIEDIKMIHVLAKAIKKINEQKMLVFNADLTSATQLFEAIGQIETILFDHIAEHLGSEELDIAIVKELLCLNRLTKELQHVQANEFSYTKEYAEKGLIDVNPHSVHTFIEEEISKRKRHLDTLLLKAPYRLMTLKQIICDNTTLSVAEEG